MKAMAKGIVLLILIFGFTSTYSFSNAPFPGQRIKVRVGGKLKKMTKETSFSSLKHNILYDVNKTPKWAKKNKYHKRAKSKSRYRYR